jgi:crotonobetainyl-CoA:carnitine CoA-transferase CaiB-like acyl-CoA transferase
MDCDVSLFDTAINLLSYPATWHLSAGFEPQRTVHSAHPSVVPFQNFATSDGWIVVACPKDKFWQGLADSIGRPDLATDDRFATFAARNAHAKELLTILEAIFRSQSSSHWISHLQAAGIPCAPVNTVAEALTDPHTEARQMIVDVPHPRFGAVRQPASPVRVGSDPVPYRRAPRRHEDAPSILRDLLHYTPEQIEVLQNGGAFGNAG